MSDSSSFILGQSRGYDYEKTHPGVRDESIEQSSRFLFMGLSRSTSIDEDDFITGFFEGVYNAREDRKEGALS